VRALVRGYPLPLLLGVVGVLALLARLLPMSTWIPSWSDAELYKALANLLYHGSDHPDAVPLNMFRTPGYPLLIGLVEPLPGSWDRGVTLIQHLTGIGLAMGVTAFAWAWLGRTVAVVSGLLVALSPLMVAVESLVYPDFAFGVVVLGGAMLMLLGATRPDGPDWRLLLAAGAVFGLSAYIKPTGQVLAAAGILPLALATRSLRPTLRGSALVALGVVVVTAPWMARNLVIFDEVQMSSASDITLHLRAFDQGSLPMPVDTDAGQELAPSMRYARAQLGDSGGSTDWVVHIHMRQERGYSPEEALQVQGEAARTAIRRHPGRYLEDTLGNLGLVAKVAGPDVHPGLRVREGLATTTVPAAGTISNAAWDVGEVLARAWWILTGAAVLSVVGLLAGPRRSRVAVATLMSVWLLVAAGTAATTHTGRGDFRFAAQLAPLLWMSATCGAVIAVGMVRDRLRGVDR